MSRGISPQDPSRRHASASKLVAFAPSAAGVPGEAMKKARYDERALRRFRASLALRPHSAQVALGALGLPHLMQRPSSRLRAVSRSRLLGVVAIANLGLHAAPHFAFGGVVLRPVADVPERDFGAIVAVSVDAVATEPGEEQIASFVDFDDFRAVELFVQCGELVRHVVSLSQSAGKSAFRALILAHRQHTVKRSSA